MLHWGVNWKDGMKIQAGQFFAERRFIAEMMRIYASAVVSELNFGIIESGEGPLYSIKNEALVIQGVTGITKGGYLLHVHPALEGSLPTLQISQLNKTYKEGENIYIFLKLNLNENLEFGEPSADEDPVRIPYSVFRINVEHASAEAAVVVSRSPQVLPVLRLIKTADSILVDDSYIPPAVKTNAIPELKRWHQQLVNLNYEIAALNSDTIQRLSSDTHTSYLKSSVTILCTQMAFFMANNMDEFSDEYPAQSPMKILVFYKKMSRIISASLVAMHNRERVIQYMADWTGNTPEGFLDKVEAISQINYNPADMNMIKSELNNFTMLIKDLFNKLQALNYLN